MILNTSTSRINATGGHLASNLGMVKTTIALHYMFMVGHTSTSVSLATGLAKARDLKGEVGNVVAIIGDGSLSGGEAFEGLNNAAMLNSNMIILFNANEMSITPNFGGMYQNFELLRQTKGTAQCNFFKSFGFGYFYVEDGNDVGQVLTVLKKVKDVDHPVVIHVHTVKEKGLAWCEADKGSSHYGMPAGLDLSAFEGVENHEAITADLLLQKMKEDPSVMAISPATPMLTGSMPDIREKAGKQFIDVGIAEEHAVGFAAGLAKNGAKPVLMAVSSFMQRTYDQLMQDMALNKTPVTILLFLANLSPGDATHCGIFDIPMMSSIPDLLCLAPATKEEYLAMFEWSMEQTDGPVVIRVPSAVVSNPEASATTAEDFCKYQITEKGNKVAVLGLGNFLGLAGQVQELLLKKKGIQATVIDPHVYSDVDRDMLENLKTDHSVVVTLEDGSLAGGFGEKIAAFYGNSGMKVLDFGGQKAFTDRVPMEVQYQHCHLTPELIVADIEECMRG